MVEFWYNIKEEYPQLYKMALKIHLCFPTACLRLDFLYTPKTTYCNKLKEESWRTQYLLLN